MSAPIITVACFHALRVAHYEVDEHGGDTWIRVSDFKGSASGNVAPFLAFAELQAERIINWEQTFARRDLLLSDYDFDTTQENATLRTRSHVFERRADADPRLHFKESFDYLLDADGSLRGEVITQERAELKVPAHFVCIKEVTAEDAWILKLADTSFSADRKTLQALYLNSMDPRDIAYLQGISLGWSGRTIVRYSDGLRNQRETYPLI